MALAKPNETQSSVYQKKNRDKGELIRDAVLNEVSDTESDDYITAQKKSNRKSHITSGRDSSGSDDSETFGDNGYFNDKSISLEEEHLMNLELAREHEESLLASQTDQCHGSASDDSWKDIPSSSRDNSHSIQLQETQVSFFLVTMIFVTNVACFKSKDVDDNDGVDRDSDDEDLNQGTGSVSTQPPAVSSSVVSLLPVNRNSGDQLTQTSARKSGSTVSLQVQSTAIVPTASYTVLPPTSNCRFSNPKKDLIMYLERKSMVKLTLKGCNS